MAVGCLAGLQVRYGRSDGQRDQQQGGGYAAGAGGGRGGYGGGAGGGGGYGSGVDMGSMGGMAAMPMAGMGGMGMMMGNSLVSLVPVQLPNGQVGKGCGCLNGLVSEGWAVTVFDPALLLVKPHGLCGWL